MLKQPLWHPSLTFEAIEDAVHRQMRGLDNPGFCLICGNEQEGCARDYNCEACGADQVFGAAELLIALS